jgi:hypothetical protein
MKEIDILQTIAEADPDDKKHMIRLERHFEHKGHLCMVFENLRQAAYFAHLLPLANSSEQHQLTRSAQEVWT